jgi:hypothetical protein
MVYHEGRVALEGFLADMQSPEPPLVIGDPCPAGFLPNPVLPPAHVDEQERMEAAAGAGADLLTAHDRLKEHRKRPWVSVGTLVACINDLTASALLEAGLKGEAESPPTLEATAVAHNTINRLSQHTAEEGGLFVQTEYFPDRPDVPFDLYLLSTLEPDRIRAFFEQGLAGGYGADASTGKGHLVVGDIDAAPWPEADDPNAGLALGVFAPADDDPARGWWRTEVRLGKVSGAWAADEGGEHPPFKYPLTLLTAGSILGPYRRPYVGRVVPNVHPTRGEVVTCAMAPVLPARCPVLEAEPTEATP